MKLASVIVSLATASTALAQNLFLDTNGSTSGAGFVTTLEWDSAIWTSSSGGTSTTSNWTPGAVANISAGNGEVATRTLNLASNIQISGLNAQNENLVVNSTGGKFTNNANLPITGVNQIEINADIDLSFFNLSYSGSSFLTLGGNNTFQNLIVNSGQVRVGQASVGAFGNGRITINGTGGVHFQGIDVAPRVVTGNVTRERVFGAENYTGTVVTGTHTLIGAVGSDPVRNGAFRSANIVLSDASGRLEYATSGNVTIDAGTLQMAPVNTQWAASFGTVTNNNGYLLAHVAGQTLSYSINGDLVLNQGNFTKFEGTTPQFGTSTLEVLLSSSGNSFINVTGTAYLGGNLVVIGEGYFGQGEEITFNLIDASSFVGTFSNITLPTLNTGFQWDTLRLPRFGGQRPARVDV